MILIVKEETNKTKELHIASTVYIQTWSPGKRQGVSRAVLNGHRQKHNEAANMMQKGPTPA